MLENPSYIVKTRGSKKLIKVVAFGSSGSGKTALIKSIDPTLRNIESGKGGTTIAFDLGILQRGECRIFFYGTPGMERFRNVISVVSNGMNIGLIVVDAARGMTEFEKSILGELRERGVPHIIVANKIDLPGASVENVRRDAGGECVILPVSVKLEAGIETLLNTIYERADNLVLAA